LRPAVDLRAARAALAGLAVPADGEVAGLGRLDAVDRIEDDLALLDLDGEVLQPAALGVAAPDLERLFVSHHFSSNSALRSSGICGSSWIASSALSPSLRMTMFFLPHSG